MEISRGYASQPCIYLPHHLHHPKANILIDRTGRAVLADFGLVTLIPDQSTLLSTYPEGGTVQWMSPELLDPEQFGLSNGWPTMESDCYALGMVIHQVLSGQAPFSTYKPPSIVLRILNGELPERPQGEAGKLFTDGIWSILQLCWKTDPKERATAKAVLACLEGNSQKLDGDDDQSDAGSMISLVCFLCFISDSSLINLVI